MRRWPSLGRPPSPAPTRGWNLVVVKVYTIPVSDTTSSSTCVPVSVASSYACESYEVAGRTRGGSDQCSFGRSQGPTHDHATRCDA